MKNKKVLIIIFSSISIFIIIVLGIYLNVNYWYRKMDEILSDVEERNDFIYYNDIHIYYNGKVFYFGSFLEINDYNFNIEYISNDYLIYSKDNKKRYDYYLIDGDGNEEKIYSSNQYISCAFMDNTFYFKKNNYYGSYNLDTKTETEMTLVEFYSKVYDSKYVVLYDDGYIITDTRTDLSKRISIEKLLNNQIVQDLYDAKKKLFWSDLILENVMVNKDNIYILISTNGEKGITIKYNFDSEESEVIDKYAWKYLEPYVKIFDLNNEVCKPIEFLLNNYK